MGVGKSPEYDIDKLVSQAKVLYGPQTLSLYANNTQVTVSFHNTRPATILRRWYLERLTIRASRFHCTPNIQPGVQDGMQTIKTGFDAMVETFCGDYHPNEMASFLETVVAKEQLPDEQPRHSEPMMRFLHRLRCLYQDRTVVILDSEAHYDRFFPVNLSVDELYMMLPRSVWRKKSPSHKAEFPGIGELPATPRLKYYAVHHCCELLKRQKSILVLPSIRRMTPRQVLETYGSTAWEEYDYWPDDFASLDPEYADADNFLRKTFSMRK
jgi:hypothetical protein